MFKFHDAVFIWITATIDHSHDPSVEMRTYSFQIFYALKINCNVFFAKKVIQ